MTDKTISATPIKSYTLAEEREEREQARQAYRQRDVLERLKSARSLGQHDADTIRDAIDEIEWLRASRPEDAITRAEMDDMAAKLLEMQATISAMLERLGKR